MLTNDQKLLLRGNRILSQSSKAAIQKGFLMVIAALDVNTVYDISGVEEEYEIADGKAVVIRQGEEGIPVTDEDDAWKLEYDTTDASWYVIDTSGDAHYLNDLSTSVMEAITERLIADLNLLE